MLMLNDEALNFRVKEMYKIVKFKPILLYVGENKVKRGQVIWVRPQTLTG